MSAFQVTCPNCKAVYTAGVVGTWSFPPHVCRTASADALSGLGCPHYAPTNTEATA